MTAALEDIKAVEVTEWATLNTAASPTKLDKGQTPNANNTWVDEKPGSVITAPGYRKVGQIPSGNPVSFCINYFKTSAGTQTFVVSDNATVWTTLDFQAFTSIITGLSSAFQLRGAVIRDKLWLTNGSDSVSVFDGSTVTVLDGTAGTPNVPKGRYIAYHDERVWMYHIPSNRSQTAFSALTDSSGAIIAPDNASAWPASNTLQISEGDADFGTGLLLFRGYLHCFKQYSIWRLVGYDEYTYTRVKTRASTGTRFAESLQILDSLVHMIGIDGIYEFDGEETNRISDIIDPASAAQESFGFNQLQQPNTNNLFWEVSSTSDWNAGVVPINASIANRLTTAPFDDSQADFAAGALTDVDATTNPGTLQLALAPTGASSNNLASGKTGSLFASQTNFLQFGSGSNITDGDLTNNVGWAVSVDSSIFGWKVDLAAVYAVSKVSIKGFYFERSDSALTAQQAKIQYSNDNVNWSDAGNVTLPPTVLHVNSFNVATNTYEWTPSPGPTFASGLGNNQAYRSAGPTDIDVNFGTAAGRYWRFMIQGNPGDWVITELQIFQSGFKPSGNYVSRTLDLGTTPTNIGNFNATYALNGGTLSFFTQTSSDGSSWDARVAVSPGGTIASTPKRYLRYQADFTYGGNGVTSPTIATVYLPTLYLSAIHDTGGSIYAWGAFESDYALTGQSIAYYYRGAATSGAVSAASWNLIVPGGALILSTTLQFVQFKIEILGATDTQIPYVNSVTINWIKGDGTQVQTLQNVASFAWRNRYWLSAASAGASANNTVLIRGKKTFKSPWQLKDWPILSFTRYQDGLYGGSSADGSIYQLDTGYSKNGAAMDSLFESGDFLFGGFYINLIEVLVEVERMGSYTLSVGISIDRGVTYTEKTVDLTLGTNPLSFVKKLNFNITCDRFRIRVRTNGVDQPFQVHNVYAFYNMDASRGSLH